MALSLLLGGARSGKSALALRRAQPPVTFIATAEARDREMAERIARHRAERPSGWTTVEVPLALEDALADAPGDACVVIDCLTLWVANLLESGHDEQAVKRRATEAARLAAGRPARTIAVSNEVGLGVVPPYAEGRRYRDVLGRVNAEWAALAEDAALVVAGRLLPLEAQVDG
jgi:adenosylcobinamide kinase/adenosylcobinamide-phosphate guanylyltransferase